MTKTLKIERRAIIISKVDDILWQNFVRQFPLVADKVQAFRAESPLDLVVELTNGERYIYDDEWQSIRKLPDSPDGLSEQQFKREFGVRLRKLMDRNDVTQLELSHRTGIDNRVISRYISGKNLPSFYAIDKIAKALGCSADAFRYI